jgi:hypothetical protein
MDKITQILENVVRCKYFEAGVHIKNPVKNSYQDGSGRTTQTLDHVVVVHILIRDKRKSQINEYSDWRIVRRKNNIKLHSSPSCWRIENCMSMCAVFIFGSVRVSTVLLNL